MPDLYELKVPQLRSIALQELGIPVETVREHGDLRQRGTWISAIEAFLVEEEAQLVAEAEAVMDAALLPAVVEESEEESEPLPRATELACLLGHPTLYQGRIQRMADGWTYIGRDERFLPLAIADQYTGIIWSLHGDEVALPLDLGNKWIVNCLRYRTFILEEVAA